MGFYCLEMQGIFKMHLMVMITGSYADGRSGYNVEMEGMVL